MYNKILLALDNSEHSEHAMESAIQLAKAFSGLLVGAHVYAAGLHGARFRQMEPGLPLKYGEEQLDRQRKIHNSLIGFGLGLISESYLDAFSKRCLEAGIEAERRICEGRNYVEIIDEIVRGGYDLMVIGALGLGRVSSSLIGSVCERVARAARCDVLIARGSSRVSQGGLVVGIDGSEDSFAALGTALELGSHLGRKVGAVAVFDPFFHGTAFRSIKKVLSKEAGKVFKFREQEKLHNEIIDDGLAKLYAGHLERAGRIAAERGMELQTRLLSGKPFEAISEHARQTEPFLIVTGRFGLHNTGRVDIGSNAENLLRMAPCDVLICGQRGGTEGDASGASSGGIGSTETPVWTPEAEARLERVPRFARPMARRGIENYAREKGYLEITDQVFDDARKGFGM